MRYNLARESWLPITTGGGRARDGLVSLRDALVYAHEISDLELTPTEFVAVLRCYLLPLASRVCQIAAADDWQRAFVAGRFDEGAVNAYIARWADRFDLFDDRRPIYQVAGLEPASGALKPISLLVASAATGNNVPLFSSSTETSHPPLSPGEAAVRLVSTLCWDTAAIKTGAKGDPRVSGGKTTGNPTGPLGSLGVVVPVGPTLFDTILLNLPVPPYVPRRAGDVPIWERDEPDGPNWRERPVDGWHDLMTYRARRIRLHADDDGRVSSVIVAAGDRLPYVDTALEPHTQWRSDPKGKLPSRPVRHRPGRGVWQGFESLLALTPTSEGVETTIQLRMISDLGGYLPDDYPLGVMTVGVEYGNQSAVVESVMADTAPLPLRALAPTGALPIRDLLLDLTRTAELVARRLNQLDADLRRAAGGDPVPWDKGARPSESLLAEARLAAHRFLTEVRREPGRFEELWLAWEVALRTLALRASERALAASPPESFLGSRSKDSRGDERWYRESTAEGVFRWGIDEALPGAAAAGTNRKETR